MDLTQEVNVSCPLPLPRPFVFLQLATEENFTLVFLTGYNELQPNTHQHSF